MPKNGLSITTNRLATLGPIHKHTQNIPQETSQVALIKGSTHSRTPRIVPYVCKFSRRLSLVFVILALTTHNENGA